MGTVTNPLQLKVGNVYTNDDYPWCKCSFRVEVVANAVANKEPLFFGEALRADNLGYKLENYIAQNSLPSIKVIAVPVENPESVYGLKLYILYLA